MSSDFFIKKADLEKHGVTFRDEICEFTEGPISVAEFPGYPYFRQVWLQKHKDGTTVNISCAGQFRRWLEGSFLKETGIEYTKF